MSASRPAPPPASFTDLLRARTKGLHRRAERSGFIARIIRGSPTRGGYALFLRNLLPVYQELERGLACHRGSLGALLRPELARSSAIERDLLHLAGPGFADALPMLPEGVGYAQRVARGAQHDGGLLLAHAYTRYLGDVSGGRILARRLSEALALGTEGLSFFEFPLIADLSEFALRYRGALDAAAVHVQAPEQVLDEAAAAFLCNISLSDAVEAMAVPGAA